MVWRLSANCTAIGNPCVYLLMFNQAKRMKKVLDCKFWGKHSKSKVICWHYALLFFSPIDYSVSSSHDCVIDLNEKRGKFWCPFLLREMSIMKSIHQINNVSTVLFVLQKCCLCPSREGALKPTDTGGEFKLCGYLRYKTFFGSFFAIISSS